MSKEKRGSDKKESLKQELKDLKKRIKNLKKKLNSIELNIKYIDNKEAQSFLLDELENSRVELGEISAIISISFKVKSDEDLSWYNLKIKIDTLNTRAESLYRRIKDVVFPDSATSSSKTSSSSGTISSPDGGSIDTKAEIERGEYPYMNDYDLAKRFILAIDTEDYQYEEVRKWDYNQISQTLLLWMEDYIAREFYGRDPFMSLNPLTKKMNIYTFKGEIKDISFDEVVEDLGMGMTQGFHDYAVGAWPTVFENAHKHQALRITGGNARDIVEATTLKKSRVVGAFSAEGPSKDEKSEKLVFRARGIPFTNADMTRFLFASIYNRGELRNSNKPFPLAMERGERVKFAEGQEQLVGVLFELIKYARNKVRAKKESDPPPPNNMFESLLELMPIASDYASAEFVNLPDETLERVAASQFIKALNFGDVSLLRAVGDKNHVRYDELEMALMGAFRASVEKYYETSESGSGAVGGKLKIADIATTAFFEAIYPPLMKRERANAVYIYRDKEGQLKTGFATRQLFDVLRDFEIPIERKVSQKVKDVIVSIHEELEKIENKLSPPIIEARKKELEKIEDELSLPIEEARKTELEEKKQKLLDEHGKTKLEEKKQELLDELAKIPEEFSQKVGADIVSIHKELEKVEDELSLPIEEARKTELEEKKQKLLDELDKIWDKNELDLYRGGIVITSVSDLISKKYPDSASAEMGMINHALPVQENITDFTLDIGNLVVQEKRDLTDDTYPTFSKEFGQKIRFLWRQVFYYWINDYTNPLSYRRYEELVNNYLRPEADQFDDENEHQRALEIWTRDWEWRGVPLAKWVYDSDGDPDYEKSTFSESQVNHLVNFQINWDKKREEQIEINPKEEKFYNEFWRRYLESDNQLEALQKLLVELVLIMNLKNFVRGPDEFTSEHTIALAEVLSREVYDANRKGLRGAILRRKTGAAGLTTGPRDRLDYEGSGYWTPEEVNSLIKHIIGDVTAHTKSKFGKDD